MSRLLTNTEIAEIRNLLFIVSGSAESIVADDRAHPIVASRAKQILRTTLRISELLKAQPAVNSER